MLKVVRPFRRRRVRGYGVGPSAANCGDEGWCGEREEGVGRYGRGESVRGYSWQFWNILAGLEIGREGCALSRKVPNEDYQLPGATRSAM